jgi:DNA-binding transcriptional MerR regulator
MKKYFKIHEISSLYGISADTLRYYERLGLLEPKRDPNGDRMYGLNDLWRINVIRDLRDLGVSMDKITLYLKNRSTRTTVSLLNEELRLLDSEIEKLSLLREQALQKLETLDKAMARNTDVIEVADIAERRYFSINEGYSRDEEMDMMIRQLLMQTNDVSIIGNNRIGSFISKDKDASGVYPYTGVFIISGDSPDILPSGSYLTMTHQGDISDINSLVEPLFGYARRHGLKCGRHVLELLWVDIHAASDRREHLTEFQLMVF